ncbi:MAG: hypothetical protein ACR2J8_11925, partial [Thermomicrobiales bacterium]
DPSQATVEDPAYSEDQPVYDESATASDGEDQGYVATCADFGSWYDAQVALENSTDPALIESLDPDYNGVACETAE